jgi:GntR family transcriptional regulator
MPESIDPTSDRPVYRQIADQLRQAIREGRYGEGDALPSETALAETYGVTRMTARQAMDVLKGEGLVRSEHGRGVFVRSRPTVRRLARNRFTKAWRESGGKGRGAYGVEASRRARRSSSAPPDVADPEEVRFLRLTPPPSIPYQSFRARAGRSGGTGRHEPQ